MTGHACATTPASRPASVRPRRRHRRVGHPRRRRQGQGAEGGRTPGDRFRRRRARLPDPRLHRRGRGRGHPRPAVAPVHPSRRPAGTARGDRRQDPARLRPRGRGVPGAGDQRRQARHLQRRRLADRPRRRGDHPGSLLGDLPGGRLDLRRRPGSGRHRREHRLPRHRRAARGSPYRAHQDADLRLTVEPDRRGLPARADRGHRALGRRARHLGA